MENIINFIHSSSLKNSVKVKLINFLLLLSGSKQRLYLSWDIEHTTEAQTEIKSIVRTFKRNERSYAFTYNQVQEMIILLEKKHKVTITGWEQYVRKYWDEVS